MNQKKIGMFIESKRKEQNLTRENFVSKLDVTTRTIINWETGKCLPDYSILISLCDILNITIDELINGEDKSKDTIELIPNEDHDIVKSLYGINSYGEQILINEAIW